MLAAESGLTESEKADGWILSCVRSATSDILLEVDDLGGVQLPAIRTLPARISSIERLAPDVVAVALRLPPNTSFEFIPGQYIDVIGPQAIRRSYSVASAPSSDNRLELHIRAVEHGVMSAYWFENAQVNDLVRLSGPLGTFFLRRFSGKHLIFLATGTGIAPVKAILEQLAGAGADEKPESITVLWGGRTERDLYFDVTAIPGDFSFIPVLSRPNTDWTGTTGYVQDALLAMQLPLAESIVYACGSDAMIHSAKSALENAGLPSKCFYSDAFVCSASEIST